MAMGGSGVESAPAANGRPGIEGTCWGPTMYICKYSKLGARGVGDELACRGYAVRSVRYYPVFVSSSHIRIFLCSESEYCSSDL